ncbi:hypothetical protein PG993_008127 [Apiospora rasikravindrae]|uniref:LPXTG cell wall anchor domain-containing protein n=1 Tax=Apiospora rasikravindrae TaxID=990691 RepID=A0ABR1SZG4_9PEZI
MATFAYPTESLDLPRRRSDAPHIEDRCYGACNAAFIKGQLSRDWEDFCVAGSAFYDYYHYCLCCVEQDLKAKGSDERGADYLAADFAGILLQCGGGDNPYRRVADPCSVPKHDISNKVQTPFPTATVHIIYPSADSLSVGVSITVPLHQLRPGQETSAASPTGMPPPTYTPIEHETTAWVTKTDANSQVTKVLSTFVTTTMSQLPALETQQPSPNDNPAPASPIDRKQGLTVAGTVVFLLLCGGLLYWLHHRRKSRKEARARLPGVKQWEVLNNDHLSPQTTRVTTGQGGGGDGGGGFEKAQLHADPLPTRELGGREVPAAAGGIAC